MTEKWWMKAGVILASWALGTALRVLLLGVTGREVILLAAINLVGCLLLGLISGIYGPRIRIARLVLAVGGVAAFTSWSTLALEPLTFARVLVSIMETFFGAIIAGLGHLAGWKIMGGDTR